MKNYDRIHAIIDLDAIVHNMEQLRKNITGTTKILAVIKADGYGHGAIPIAQILRKLDYLWGFAVATAEEAFMLRDVGIREPILILGYTFPAHYEEIVARNITQTIFDMDTAKTFSCIGKKLGKAVRVHIAIDTGMSRIGFTPNQESLHIIKEITSLSSLECEGIFTHFAKADVLDKTSSHTQLNIFTTFIKDLEKLGVHFPFKHSSNSAGIIDLQEANMDLVRGGISIYGLYPSDEVNQDFVKLKPALSLKSHIVYVKEVEAGTGVSYGSTFITSRPTKIATIPIGYADGYPRSLSNKGYVLIHGKKAPILGRVCMDQFMVDVSHVESVRRNDLVTLIGEDMGETVTIEELSKISGRFNYEFVCDISKRVPRIYVRNGEIVAEIDYFSEVCDFNS